MVSIFQLSDSHSSEYSNEKDLLPSLKMAVQRSVTRDGLKIDLTPT